jgi:predicted metal-dependent hydrolase
MVTQLDLGSIRVDVVRKNIKNIHLGVYPPTGKVRISAPAWVELDAIRLFAISKLGWIRQQQKKLLAQERETPREYLERESHYVWGRRYLLQIVEVEARPSIRLTHRHLRLQVRPGADLKKREVLLADWYRSNLKLAVPALLAKWEPIVGAHTQHVYVQHMKTKWGSCNPTARNIRLNTELAKKPPECLEYILVHELVHLCEPTHNDRFIALMNRLMPHWRDCRDMLNRLPVRNEHWHY